RAKALLNFLLRRRAHAAVRAAVKRVFRADDLVAFSFLAGFLHAVQPRELDQRLVRLRTAVAEKNAARPGEVHDPARELTLQRIAKQIADVDQFGGLTLHRGHPIRMAVTERADRDARSEIEIAVAGVVPHLRAAAAHEREGG